MGLRERKRLRTLRAIEDATLDLVEERGFDAVTVEEICAVVEISPRTFFNYVDSKAHALLGQKLMQRTRAVDELLATGPHANLLEALLSAFSSKGELTAEERALLYRNRARRRAIIAETPTLAAATMAHFSELFGTLETDLVTHFVAFPDSQILHDVPAELEASLLIGMLRDAVYGAMSYTGPTPHSSLDPAESPTSVVALARRRAQLHSQFAQGLTWSQ